MILQNMKVSDLRRLSIERLHNLRLAFQSKITDNPGADADVISQWKEELDIAHCKIARRTRR